MNRLFAIAVLVSLSLYHAAAQQSPPRGVLNRFFYEFNYIDTTYVEPNHYNWAFMLQNTNTYEWLSLNANGAPFSLSPDPQIKIGPYIGWRWLFLGYTFTVNDIGRAHSTRTEWEASLYGSMLGCDLIYRKTGDDFKWRKSRDNATIPEGEYSGGIKLRTIGANAYYIFNHRRFSYPSLFSQSTVQKRSTGSWMVGLSVTSHRYDFNVTNWPVNIPELGNGQGNATLNYMDYAISAGYAYNWVITRNLMLGISLMPAIGYKHISSDSEPTTTAGQNSFTHRIGNNLNYDITGRAALVWNNNKYFAGLSIIVHNYNFSRNDLSIHSTFGTVNLYVGFNFIKRKAYRQKK